MSRIVILAGLAGGLDDACPAGSAQWITRVHNPNASPWHPTAPDPRPLPRPRPARLITSHDAAIATPSAKAKLRHRSAAHLVDQESVAFARIASELQWSWAIIRGVSDDANTALPTEVVGWVDTRGQTRYLRAARDLCLHPQHLPAICRLHRASRAALRAVAAEINAFTDAIHRAADPDLDPRPGDKPRFGATRRPQD